jgi:glycosyltransferase involved in cell wall biosynthesis
MAMGRCIVAPDQPNIRELLRDGLTARLFPPEDYRRLVELIAELMRAPAERAILGRNAYQSTIDRHLIWRANAARALALLFNEQHDREVSRRATMVQPPRQPGKPRWRSGAR